MVLGVVSTVVFWANEALSLMRYVFTLAVKTDFLAYLADIILLWVVKQALLILSRGVLSVKEIFSRNWGEFKQRFLLIKCEKSSKGIGNAPLGILGENLHPLKNILRNQWC